MNYWLVVGTTQNWDTAFKHGNIWGLKETQRHLWQTLNENDKLLFYATKPVGGIIGHGIVRTKFRQNKPLWPEEIRRSKVIWPLRFEFDVDFCLPSEKRVSEKIVAKELWPRAGFQLLDQSTAKTLVSSFLGTGKHAVEVSTPSLFAEPTAEYSGVKRTTLSQIITSETG
jgi:hypothetical protein